MKKLSIYIALLFLISGCKKESKSDFRDLILGNYSLKKCSFSNSISGTNENCDTAPVMGSISMVGDSSLFFEGDTFTLSYQGNDKIRFWASQCSYSGNGQSTCLIDFFKPDSVFIVKASGSVSSQSGTRWFGRKK